MTAATNSALEPRDQAATDFRIVSALRSDMAKIAGFIRSSADWYREFVDQDDMSEHDVDENWQEVNFRRRDFYLGIDGTQEVGTISIQEFGDHLYLGYIYLDVEQVGKGYGRKLMLHAMEEARRRQKAGLALICHPRAAWAMRAYSKFGFQPHATVERDVLAWKNGALEEYYEKGFHLLTCPVDRGQR